ncbi:MAG TPA: MarR family transcriptional regulator [Aquabacterium sp.]|nr:MarR family transcriptional regulator [Aquabacterium sp.]
MPSSTSPQTPNWLSLDQQLCFALYSASLAMTKQYKPLLEPLGLTYPQYLVMLVLWEGTPISVKDLGARLGLDSGTLTPLLKRLEGAGLIHRSRDSEDERRVLIQLRPDGLALRDRAVGIPQTVACKFGLEMDEISALRNALNRIKSRLD